MPDGVNGSGFNSREDAERYHAQRLRPQETKLNYQYAARTRDDIMREPLPPSPLDGPQLLQQPAQPPVQEVEQGLIPQPFGPQTKKSLKEIAMERGHIPRKG